MLPLSTDRSTQLSRAIEIGLLDGSPPSALFMDLAAFDRRLDELERCFPSNALHCLAIKACPLPGVLERATARGMGLECASAAELALALQLAPPERIVFDSPAKTKDELRWALDAGVHINVDSLQELARIRELKPGPEASVGVRINPRVGAGSIAETSTAMAGSKFGIDMHHHRSTIVEALNTHPWLRGVHVHVGSQGCGLELLRAGVGVAVDLVETVRSGGKQVDWIDIGGGLPVAYREDEVVPDHAQYAAELRESWPRLFDASSRIVTEFGRSLLAPVGWAVSRVEVTKMSGERRIAVIHLGADLLLRTAYRPEQWYHGLRVFDAHGRPKTGPLEAWDVAGPLCFSGDLLARGRQLPPIEPGDWICVEDVGAYSLSMWSRYNSRRSPAVHGIEADGRIHCLRQAETIEEVLGFWR